jgi:hypothetical protein
MKSRGVSKLEEGKSTKDGGINIYKGKINPLLI